MKANLLAIIAVIVLAQSSLAQVPRKNFHAETFSTAEYAALKKAVGKNKLIPACYEKQIVIALAYFPELKNTHIIFRIRHAHTPLETKPEWFTVTHLLKDKRFIITISDSSSAKLSPILFRQLDFNAQIGVIGHELSHVTDFLSKNIVGLTEIGIGHFSHVYLDKFEFRTDSICIAHGLGYQLLAWSSSVRNRLHLQNWGGAYNINAVVMKRERYMNPSTIKAHIESSKVYQD
jgi:hypothetical protein